MRTSERDRAITLRKQGQTYSEILKAIPVAKSTLSIWLRSVGLAKKQKQILSDKKRDAALRGAQAKRFQKEERIRQIKTIARAEIGKLTEREKWLIGTALYWGEGSKEKDYHPGSGLVFNNSDPVMTKFYINWLEDVCHIPRTRIQLTLYVHDTKRADVEKIKVFWTSYLHFPKDSIAGVYFKKSRIRTVRRNTGSLYCGTMRVKVSGSSALNRKVAGWVEGIAGVK